MKNRLCISRFLFLLFEAPGDQPALYSLYICVSLGGEFQRFTGFGADKSAADNNYLFRHFILQGNDKKRALRNLIENQGIPPNLIKAGL